MHRCALERASRHTRTVCIKQGRASALLDSHLSQTLGAKRLSLLRSCADPSSGVSVRPVASSTLNSAVPAPTIPGATSVAAANADTLAASQASSYPDPVPQQQACARGVP